LADTRKKIVIVGATSAIAEHCARIWARDDAIVLTLVGRDPERLRALAADLRVRSPRSTIDVVTADFIDPVAIQQLTDAIAAQGVPDTVLIAHGSLPDQQECQRDLSACGEALRINGVSPVLFAEAFAGRMQDAGRGTLAIIGSVAGDRGRKSNYVYGAAKGLLARYAQGLQHRLAGTGVAVVLIKPGPTDTPMTAHLKQSGAKLAPVADVAQIIVAAIGKRRAVAYAPARWAMIMQVIRHLPQSIFNRLNI
jgi:decaprenylphospho-beta-D-erythro-pentofuranosid-2-ulose 2-reductase